MPRDTTSLPADSALGVDYRITDQLAIGVMGEYSHTWTSLEPNGSIDVNSGRGGVYATWYNHGIYLNGAICGGHNNYIRAAPAWEEWPMAVPREPNGARLLAGGTISILVL